MANGRPHSTPPKQQSPAQLGMQWPARRTAASSWSLKVVLGHIQTSTMAGHGKSEPRLASTIGTGSTPRRWELAGGCGIRRQDQFSGNGGASWTSAAPDANTWYSVACSADCAKIVAVSGRRRDLDLHRRHDAWRPGFHQRWPVGRHRAQVPRKRRMERREPDGLADHPVGAWDGPGRVRIAITIFGWNHFAAAVTHGRVRRMQVVQHGAFAYQGRSARHFSFA